MSGCTCEEQDGWASAKETGFYDPDAGKKDADVVIKASKLNHLRARIAELESERDELRGRVEELEKQKATIAGMRMEVDESIPFGEIHVRNNKGDLVGKIVNVLTSEGK